ncbi:MAG TPA: hypothetical protein VIS31_07940 [Woeseiaceae bacterium]
MNTTSGNSARSLPAGGRLLAVLAVFWLNLVVAPCSYAIASEHDCPHCPPEQMGEMAAHHGHHEDMAGSGCDALMSDCDDTGSMAHDGRSLQPKLKDQSEPAPMAPPAFPQAPLDVVGFATTAADPPEPDGFPPALHLLNCVFLD